MAVEHYTTGQLAKILGQPRHVIEYAIVTKDIPHVDRVGIIRLFDGEALQELRKLLAEARPDGRGRPRQVRL